MTEQRAECGPLKGACEAVGSRLGIGREMLRTWVSQARVDADESAGVPTDKREEIRTLTARVRRLEEDNAIQKAAATFLAGGAEPPKAKLIGFIESQRKWGYAVESICRVLTDLGCRIAARTYRAWTAQAGSTVGEDELAYAMNEIHGLVWTSDATTAVRRLTPAGL